MKAAWRSAHTFRSGSDWPTVTSVESVSARRVGARSPSSGCADQPRRSNTGSSRPRVYAASAGRWASGTAWSRKPSGPVAWAHTSGSSSSRSSLTSTRKSSSGAVAGDHRRPGVAQQVEALERLERGEIGGHPAHEGGAVAHPVEAVPAGVHDRWPRPGGVDGGRGGPEQRLRLAVRRPGPAPARGPARSRRWRCRRRGGRA